MLVFQIWEDEEDLCRKVQEIKGELIEDTTLAPSSSTGSPSLAPPSSALPSAEHHHPMRRPPPPTQISLLQNLERVLHCREGGLEITPLVNGSLTLESASLTFLEMNV